MLPMALTLLNVPIGSVPCISTWLTCRHVLCFARSQHCSGIRVGNGELQPTFGLFVRQRPDSSQAYQHGCVPAIPWALRMQVSISNFKDFFDDYRGLFSSMLVKLQCDKRDACSTSCDFCVCSAENSGCLAARYLRVLETERDRSLDKQQRELIGEIPCLQSNLRNEMELRESD